jgi:SAM-dependent methyltransferase
MEWEILYRQGTPPWDVGRPAAELLRVLEEGLLPRGTVLELGCGSGADAVCLAKHGFEVTAVDISPLAIERARARAEQQRALVRFVLADVLEFGLEAGQFDVVYDAGFYHHIRSRSLGRFLEVLWRVTRPGSLCLALIGAPGEQLPDSPPQVREQDIRRELGRLFEFVHLRRCRLESAVRSDGYPGWSCLMRRPLLRR